LLEAVEFDSELAGATLLGRDVARICLASTSERARALLSSSRLLDQIVGQMVQTSSHSEAVATVTRIVNGFCRDPDILEAQDGRQYVVFCAAAQVGLTPATQVSIRGAYVAFALPKSAK
jgi:hypothetical protein